MKVSDIPVGSLLAFGRTNAMASTRIMELVWRKAGQNNGFYANENISTLPMDASESESKSRNCRDYGSNYFPQSNLCRFLNSSGRDWFEKQHETDVLAWQYAGSKGFLTLFEEWELQAIVPHEIVTKVPCGFKRQFGEISKTTLRVSIPSLSQVMTMDDQSEGEIFESCSIIGAPRGCFTRTAYATGMYALGNSAVRKAPNVSYGIRPYVQIDGSNHVALDADTGRYILLPSEEYTNKTKEELDRLLL